MLRRIVPGLVAVVLATTTATACASGGTAGIVLGDPPGQVGSYFVGMSIDSMKRVGGANLLEIVTCTERGCDPGLVLMRENSAEEHVLAATMGTDSCGTPRVKAIELFDSTYRTREGIGVGTARDHVMRSYALTAGAAHTREYHADDKQLWFTFETDVQRGGERVRSVIVRDTSGSSTKATCTKS